MVGAVVGVVKYTGRDNDVERHSKGVKGKLEKKGASPSTVKAAWIFNVYSFGRQVRIRGLKKSFAFPRRKHLTWLFLPHTLLISCSLYGYRKRSTMVYLMLTRMVLVQEMRSRTPGNK